MRINLKQLVAVTCITLTGIVSLQVFWLIKTYKEKKEQLIARANNIMLETHIFTGVSPALNSLASSLVESINNLDSISPKDSVLLSIQKEYRDNVDSIAVETPVASKHENNLKKILSGVFNTKGFTLDAYKRKLEDAFSANGTHTPIELAISDIAGNITGCTIDTAFFKNITIKSGTDKGFNLSLPVRLNKKHTGYLQLAFPKGSLYLLKSMSLLLLLSLLFISVCCLSFAYMVAFFFKEKRLAEMRNNFMNNMTHELKTPISSVSLALELLQDKSVVITEPKEAEYFQAAERELNRLSMLVDKVLKMAAYENEKVTLTYQEFAVKPWIEQIINTVLHAGSKIIVDVKLVISPPELMLWGDREHLSGLMQNLLENAVKYKNKHLEVLMIKIEIADGISHYHITVTDNGIGIAQQHVERIFDKFFRVSTGDRHETQGYGLGLSYVQEIVKLHNGTITVKSELKHGSSFTVLLPKKANE